MPIFQQSIVVVESPLKSTGKKVEHRVNIDFLKALTLLFSANTSRKAVYRPIVR